MTSPQRSITPTRVFMLAASLALGACASVPRQAYTAAEAQVADIACLGWVRAIGYTA